VNKQDTVGTVLRKFDYMWSKKSKTFCQIVKEITEGNLELSDEEISERIKHIFPDEKEK